MTAAQLPRLEADTPIYVAGHRGLAGSAIWRALERRGCANLVGATSDDVDLRDRDATAAFVRKHRPRVMVVAAARVGGILAYAIAKIAGVTHVQAMRRQHRRRHVTIWGSGRPRRELLHVDDLADAACFLLEHYDDAAPINVGTGVDLTIAELAHLVADVVGFRGELVFDPSKPDGTPRKVLDVGRLAGLGWTPSVGLREGIERTYAWFVAHQATARL